MPDVEAWPELPLAEWSDTLATLHRWVQVVGKTRLALAPPQNHWWHCTLYLTARGIGTSVMPAGDFGLDIEFDFISHRLLFITSDGRLASMALAPRTVADFHREYTATLADLGVAARIRPVPVEMADTLRFDEDVTHHAYDADAVNRCWRILANADRLFKRFRGPFLGKSSPSHFWWGAFDLSCTRFSGRPAPVHPGGIPNCPDFVTREAYSHECMSVGWWPGGAGVDEPAFYAYAYPEPAGCSSTRIAPEAARYDATLREWILPYSAVRSSPDPDATVLAFCESTYATAATLGNWDTQLLRGATMASTTG